jgi:hypothetical protein
MLAQESASFVIAIQTLFSSFTGALFHHFKNRDQIKNKIKIHQIIGTM